MRSLNIFIRSILKEADDNRGEPSFIFNTMQNAENALAATGFYNALDTSYVSGILGMADIDLSHALKYDDAVRRYEVKKKQRAEANVGAGPTEQAVNSSLALFGQNRDKIEANVNDALTVYQSVDPDDEELPYIRSLALAQLLDEDFAMADSEYPYNTAVFLIALATKSYNPVAVLDGAFMRATMIPVAAANLFSSDKAATEKQTADIAKQKSDQSLAVLGTSLAAGSGAIAIKLLEHELAIMVAKLAGKTTFAQRLGAGRFLKFLTDRAAFDTIIDEARTLQTKQTGSVKDALFEAYRLTMRNYETGTGFQKLHAAITKLDGLSVALQEILTKPAKFGVFVGEGAGARQIGTVEVDPRVIIEPLDELGFATSKVSDADPRIVDVEFTSTQGAYSAPRPGVSPPAKTQRYADMDPADTPKVGTPRTTSGAAPTSPAGTALATASDTAADIGPKSVGIDPAIPRRFWSYITGQNYRPVAATVENFQWTQAAGESFVNEALRRLMIVASSGNDIEKLLAEPNVFSKLFDPRGPYSSQIGTVADVGEDVTRQWRSFATLVDLGSGADPEGLAKHVATRVALARSSETVKKHIKFTPDAGVNNADLPEAGFKVSLVGAEEYGKLATQLKETNSVFKTAATDFNTLFKASSSLIIETGARWLRMTSTGALRATGALAAVGGIEGAISEAVRVNKDLTEDDVKLVLLDAELRTRAVKSFIELREFEKSNSTGAPGDLRLATADDLLMELLKSEVGDDEAPATDPSKIQACAAQYEADVTDALVGLKNDEFNDEWVKAGGDAIKPGFDLDR